MSNETVKEEKGYRWWLRYVFVPLAVACIGGGGIVAIIVAFIPLVFPTPTPTIVTTPPDAAAASTSTATPIPPTNTPVPPTATPTLVPPTDTPTPAPTSRLTDTPQLIRTPTATIGVDLTLYDDFNDPANDGKWNAKLWALFSEFGDPSVNQQNGVLTISHQSPETGGLYANRPSKWTVNKLGFVEARIMLDGNIEASEGTIGMGINDFATGGEWWLSCDIYGRQERSTAWANCDTSESSPVGSDVPYNSWHTMRFEIDPDTAEIKCLLDNHLFHSFIPADPDAFKKTEFSVTLHAWSDDGGLVKGYIDEVRIGKKGQ